MDSCNTSPFEQMMEAELRALVNRYERAGFDRGDIGRRLAALIPSASQEPDFSLLDDSTEVAVVSSSAVASEYRTVPLTYIPGRTSVSKLEPAILFDIALTHLRNRKPADCGLAMVVWLNARHGVHLGDNVMVFDGTSSPVHFMLNRITLQCSTDSIAEDAYLYAEGRDSAGVSVEHMFRCDASIVRYHHPAENI